MGGGVIRCLEHHITVYAGVCPECVPPSVKQGECSRGPDAAPNAAKRYAGSAMYPGEEAGPLKDQPLRQLEDE